MDIRNKIMVPFIIIHIKPSKNTVTLQGSTYCKIHKRRYNNCQLLGNRTQHFQQIMIMFTFLSLYRLLIQPGPHV